MDYDPRSEHHGLAHDPVLSLVVPRPIGWFTTISPAGVVNLAPYSFFNLVCGRPPFIMFASSTRKHSQAHTETLGEFVFNLATWDLRTEMNISGGVYDEGVIVDGLIDISRIRPIARLGYMDYSVVDNVFTMLRV